MGTLTGNTSLTLSEQQSGGILGTIYLALFDEFGQIVGNDGSSTVSIAIEGYHGSDDYTPVLSGTTTATVYKGVVIFTDLEFTAEPGVT